MGCGCGGTSAGMTSQGVPVARQVYVHTKPNGETDSYQSEVEVAAAVSRVGGTYRMDVPV